MKVAIIMGSNSDYPTMVETEKILDQFEIEYETKVMSAHRTPDMVIEFSKSARANGYGVIIAAAGGAAHLAGVIASSTTLPVIGVPIKAKTLDGLDSLLSTVQMPSGVPVATVGINQAANAGLLAIQMLGIEDEIIISKLDAYKLSLIEKVRNMKLEKETK
ncbi:MAG: 5-(carboxyamino)imidazole ribonucleotide mutase [Bacilli bacterium]|jgi:5-(carboxyamino)imidazole ribonucleotide mutase|nr:5-(carboxyamino)imidazole ribonucleotide mutase [Bacilli bacterium]